MTSTENTTDTRKIQPGDAVVKTTEPRIEVGTVLSVNENGTAYVVGRRAEDQPWLLIAVAADMLATSEAAAAAAPGVAEIGQALLAKEAELRAGTADEQAIRAEARLELARYKATVRDNIISHGSDYGNDHDETNALLDALGLDLIEREWDVTVDLTATQSVSITVTAANDEDAAEVVRQMDSGDLMERASSYDWEFSDMEVDTYNVTEA